MSPTDIEDILQEYPNHSIRLTLSSGDYIQIPHSGAVRISGTKIAIFPDLERGRFFTERNIKYVSVVNVAMIEPLQTIDPPSSKN